MRNIYLIVFLVYLVSCSQIKEPILTIYVENESIDFEKEEFPNFDKIDRFTKKKYTHELNQITINNTEYNILKKIFERVESKNENKNNKYLKRIFLVNKQDSIYFNYYNDFYNSHSKYIFNNRELANKIRLLLSQESSLMKRLSDSNNPPLYFEIKIIYTGKI